MTQLIECVPNFSEGRRPEVIDQIVAAIVAVAGTHLLDREMDAAHNRAVVTFIGAPEAVREGAFAGIAKATELIDMNVHQGEHPRLGATDVCPFIPLVGAGLEDCIVLAKQLGREVADRLHLPVYLYEAAAVRPERENLAHIRRGEYEALKAEMGKDPSRDPDLGEARMHPTAGAIVIGARMPLVAYNVYLNTRDLGIAQKIAKAIRQRSGGFAFCKALGFEIEARAMVQVSMNLTDHTRTPIFRVFEVIQREARRYGTSVHSSEIVGLAPERALVDCADYFLQLENFKPEQIIEQQLLRLFQGKAPAPEPPATFFDRVAAGTPAPGGGSVAAAGGALASALVSMVSRLTLGKKKFAAVSDQMSALLEESESLRARLTRRIEEDSESFAAVLSARSLPKGTSAEQEQRTTAMAKAMLSATLVPLETMRDAQGALLQSQAAARTGNPNCITDAGVAALLAAAAVEGAWLNVLVNLGDLADRQEAARIRAEAERLLLQSRTLKEEVLSLVQDRLTMAVA
jgi:glutamate formiminotransferase/formiminotetrahydrofolate cyclodeaminase